MQGRPTSGEAEYEPHPDEIARAAAAIRARHSPHQRRAAMKRAGVEVQTKVPAILVRCHSQAQRDKIHRLAAALNMSLQAYCLAALLGEVDIQRESKVA